MWTSIFVRSPLAIEVTGRETRMRRGAGVCREIRPRSSAACRLRRHGDTGPERRLPCRRAAGSLAKDNPALGAAVGNVCLALSERNSSWRGHVAASIAARRRHRSPIGTSPVPGGPDYLPAAMADVSTLMFRVAVPLQGGQHVRAVWQRRCGSCPGHTSTTTRGVVAAHGHPGRHRSGRGATLWLRRKRMGSGRRLRCYSPRAGVGNFHGAPGSRARLHERVA